MNTLDVIRDYIGQELTTQYAQWLANAPEEHIGRLIERLAPHYYDWLEREEANHTTSQENRYLCIDPYPRERTWQQQLEVFKKYLLYFPRFVMPDPLASFLWPHITSAALFGTVTIDEKFRQNLHDALALLAELAPVVDDKDTFLMPATFAMDYSSVQDGARKELEAIDENGKDKYYKPLSDLAKNLFSNPAENRSTEEQESHISKEGMRMIVGAVQVWGQICGKLQLTPVAGNSFVKEILKQDYDRGIQYLLVSNRTQRVTETMLQYDVPGVAKASFESIIALRKNDDAFNEWRRDFGRILDKTREENPSGEKQFEVEFSEAARDILSPRIKELEKATASSALEKIFTPAALSIGAGAVAFYVLGAPFPTTALASVSVAPAGWVIDKINKRFNKTGRKAVILKELYGYLLDKE